MTNMNSATCLAVVVGAGMGGLTRPRRWRSYPTATGQAHNPHQLPGFIAKGKREMANDACDFHAKYRRAVCGVFVAFSFLGALALCGTASADQSVVDLPVRPAVTLRFKYVEPVGQARAAVILLHGANGRVGIFPNGSMSSDQAFLTRNVSAFASKGLVVVVVDPPSDHASGLYGFRYAAEHAADLGKVIAWLRDKTRLPVWLIGHSRGTESAVSTAIRLGAPPNGPDGLVLAAPALRAMSFPGRLAKDLFEFPLDQLQVPTLVVMNEADGCLSSPPSELPALDAKLPKNLPRRSVVTIAGGNEGRGGCELESFHSFSGRNEQAVDTIAEFVLQP